VIDELNVTITDLLTDNGNLLGEIDSLKSIIEAFEPELIAVTLIKDVVTGVDTEEDVNLSKSTTLTVIGETVQVNELMSEGINWVYVIDVTGKVVFERQSISKSELTSINVSGFVSGVYFVYIVSSDNTIQTYRFIKI